MIVTSIACGLMVLVVGGISSKNQSFRAFVTGTLTPVWSMAKMPLVAAFGVSVITSSMVKLVLDGWME